MKRSKWAKWSVQLVLRTKACRRCIFPFGLEMSTPIRFHISAAVAEAPIIFTCSPRRLVPMLAIVAIGLLGGTFDPPHIAHLLAGEVAYRQLGLDRVLFVPAGSPWQKAGKAVSLAEQRWQMTRLATEGINYFEADDREVIREGLTYTVETLATYPEEEELWLILGADAARGLLTWERADEVLSRARVAVLPRPGVDPQEVEDAIGPSLWLDMAPVAISGTDIRQRVATGVGYRFMVTEAVYRYIEAEQLYLTSPIEA